MADAVNRRSYKHVALDDKWDAVVIGSGIGGLTAAVLLSVHGGKRVLVLERHYAMGGFTTSARCRMPTPACGGLSIMLPKEKSGGTQCRRSMTRSLPVVRSLT